MAKLPNGRVLPILNDPPNAKGTHGERPIAIGKTGLAQHDTGTLDAELNKILAPSVGPVHAWCGSYIPDTQPFPSLSDLPGVVRVQLLNVPVLIEKI